MSLEDIVSINYSEDCILSASKLHAYDTQRYLCALFVLLMKLTKLHSLYRQYYYY